MRSDGQNASENQRILDVKESLKKREAVLWTDEHLKLEAKV